MMGSLAFAEGMIIMEYQCGAKSRNILTAICEILLLLGNHHYHTVKDRENGQGPRFE